MADPPRDLTNTRIAELFDELGDLSELDGAVVHRVLAYRNAAKAVRDASRSVAALTREGTVTSLPGIGKYSVDAVVNNDLPKVLGVVIVGSLFIILANLVVDLLYAVADPRVRTR